MHMGGEGYGAAPFGPMRIRRGHPCLFFGLACYFFYKKRTLDGGAYTTPPCSPLVYSADWSLVVQPDYLCDAALAMPREHHLFGSY